MLFTCMQLWTKYDSERRLRWIYTANTVCVDWSRDMSLEEDSRWLEWVTKQFESIAGDDKEINLEEFKTALKVKEVSFLITETFIIFLYYLVLKRSPLFSPVVVVIFCGEVFCLVWLRWQQLHQSGWTSQGFRSSDPWQWDRQTTLPLPGLRCGWYVVKYHQLFLFQCSGDCQF